MVEIQVDGASRGNPGISGAGIVIKNNGRIEEFSLSLGLVSNHEAEFLAVIHALKICQEQFTNKMIAIQSDSQIVVNAIENNYVKNPLFKPFLDEIKILSKSFPYVFVKWVPNVQNKHADHLARKAIQMQLNE